MIEKKVYCENCKHYIHWIEYRSGKKHFVCKNPQLLITHDTPVRQKTEYANPYLQNANNDCIYYSYIAPKSPPKTWYSNVTIVGLIVMVLYAIVVIVALLTGEG